MVLTQEEQNELSTLVTALIISNYNANWFHLQLERIFVSFEKRGLKAKSPDFQRHELKHLFSTMWNVNGRIQTTLQKSATFAQADQINELSEYVGMATMNLLALPTEWREKALMQMNQLTEEYGLLLKENLQN